MPGINSRPLSAVGALLGILAIGCISRDGARIGTLRNAAPMAAQVDTLTPANPTADETLTLTFLPSGLSEALVLTFETTAAHSTAALLGTAIADAWNADPLFNGWAVASVNGSGVVTITGRDFTGSWTLTATMSAGATTTVTRAAVTTYASADAIPFGRLVVKVGNDTTSPLAVHGATPTGLGALARSTRLTARVDTHTLTYDAGVDWTVRIEFDGQPYEATVTMATDGDTSAAAMQTALASALPDDTAPVPTVSGSVLTLTAPAGYSMTSSSSFGADADTAAAAIVSTGAGIADLECGISVAANDEEQPAGGGDAVYPANAGVRVLKSGYIIVELASGDAPGINAPVYVDLSDAATAGKFHASAGPNRLRVPGARWSRLFIASNRAELAFGV